MQKDHLPFLKYCINNSVIPLLFLIFYYVNAYHFLRSQELFSNWEIIFLLLGFLCGVIIALAVAFGYFFGADRTIYRFLPSSVKEELVKHKTKFSNGNKKSKGIGIKNMNSRAKESGGVFEIKSEKGKGTVSVLVVPFKKANNKDEKH